MPDPQRVAVYTIPSHRSFADALAAGLIGRYGKSALGLAEGRILLPNNRAVRAVTDAFVRQSGSGCSCPIANCAELQWIHHPAYFTSRHTFH